MGIVAMGKFNKFQQKCLTQNTQYVRRRKNGVYIDSKKMLCSPYCIFETKQRIGLKHRQNTQWKFWNEIFKCFLIQSTRQERTLGVFHTSKTIHQWLKLQRTFLGFLIHSTRQDFYGFSLRANHLRSKLEKNTSCTLLYYIIGGFRHLSINL